jgi:hypothetical protein
MFWLPLSEMKFNSLFNTRVSEQLLTIISIILDNTVKVIKIPSKLFLFILMPLEFCEKREHFLHGHQKPDGE